MELFCKRQSVCGVLVAAGFASALVVGCGGGAAQPGIDPVVPGGQTQRSAHARSAPDAPTADVSTVALADANFGTDLYHTLAGTAGNLVSSPHSISLALGMTWAGAENTTASQMASALHFTLAADRQQAAFNTLDQTLNGRASAATGLGGGQSFQLHVVNALWGQTGYTFLAPFLDTLAEDYGAGLTTLDFAHSPDPSRLAINSWVSGQTSGKIPNLLGPGSVDSDTRLVLTNAVYFNASWVQPFVTSATTNAAFTRADGSSVTVPTMSGAFEGVGYAQGSNWQAVSLPYVGNQVSMLLILPAAGTLAAFEQALTGDQIASIAGSLGPHEVNITLPKFSFHAQFSLGTALQSLGMTDAFRAGLADFSGMDGTHDLFIQDVIHEGYIGVDETGTEAAAATAVVVGTDAVEAPVMTVHFDHPFLFVIRDQPTGTVLFLGRVSDPSAS